MTAAAGGARTWVLLRGLTRESAHWGDFASRLAQALRPGARVVALDLPGTGDRRDVASPARIDAIADSCRAALPRRLPDAAPLCLVGLSLGGMVAAAWAARHPGEVERVVLVNSSLRPHAPWHRRLRPAALPALLRVLLSAARDAQRAERVVLALTSAEPQRHADAAAAWAAIRTERPVARRDALCQLFAAARWRQDAPPPVPVLVACSAGDRLVDPRCSRELAARWGATLVEHRDAGHDLPLDDGEWLAARIAEWAARVPPG